MQRDVIKTFAGLVIIAGIVVGTFLYGNSQRQAQITHDLAVKQQAATIAAQKKATVAPPAGTAAPANTQVAAANNTAPVKSPTSNSIQGNAGSGTTLGAKSTPTPTPTPAASPVATPVAVAAAAAPASSNLPTTGPGTVGLIGFGAIAFMLIALRASRRSMLAAARTRR
jgi:hypothetical protein